MIVAKPGFISWGSGSSPPLPEADDDPQNNSEQYGEVSAINQSSIDEVSAFLSRMTSATEFGGDGRTYHEFKKGKYPMPNDKREQERLDFQHKALQITFAGHLHFSPLGPNTQNVLDLGTGTGIWAIEFANEYPTIQVLGTDLSAIQPIDVPQNCRFQVADAEDEWIFPPQFDLIHGRALLSCFEDPKVVLRHAFKALAPGGYLEMHDGTFPLKYIGNPPVTSAVYKWSEIVVAGGEKFGRPWTNAQHYKRWMEEIGFEDVAEKQFYLLTSPWAKGEYFKQVGRYYGTNLQVGLENISLKVMEALGWEVEDAKLFLQSVREELEGNRVCAYLPVNVVYGRKPLNLS